MVLLISLAVVILTRGASDVLSMGYKLLLGASAVCVALTLLTTTRGLKVLMLGVRKSVRQIFPAVPVLVFIGTVGATWMLSGVVPGMIYYGVKMLNPVMFLFLACSISAVVSVMSGTSWTTIATIGVAFMGIGTVMGYDEAWIAGAVISGAYFGDKVSPLSDTTVLAASSTGVKLFSHIRSLMVTTVPAMAIALAVFACVGLLSGVSGSFDQVDICDAITSTFNISPWLALVPLLTIALLAMRAGTTLTLAVSSVVALAVMFVCQPQIVEMLSGGDSGFMAGVAVGARV
ncbi:MAG: sodium:proton antiporter, partial [Paramuribaculum sp.]|nr:sodium:proton antiporter [Paramuribaculum sp.]